MLKGSFFCFSYDLEYGTASFISTPFFEALQKLPYWRVVVHAISILLVFLQAVIFNQILLINRITRLQTYVPAAIFITLSSLHPEFIIFNPVNLSYILILPVFYNIFRLPYEDNAVEVLFYSGFLIAVASLLYFPAAYLLIFLVFGLIWLKNPTGREFIMPFVAFLLPYLLVGVYYFVTDQFIGYLSTLEGLLPSNVGIVIANPGPWILAGFVFMLVIAGYFKASRVPQRDVIQFGKFLTVLLAAIIIGLGYLFFLANNALMFGYLFLAPVSIFIGSLFDEEKPGFILRALFWGLILLAAFFQWEYYSEIIGEPIWP